MPDQTRRPRQTCREPHPTSTPLSHPAWWAALALLLVNDHLLKGAGVLPGWLTGKLSDFAGLLMAPPLLVVLLRARRPLTKLGCFAAVALLFAAIKIHPPVARALEAAMGALGIPWQIWCDPTDLIALLILPFGWLLLEPRVAERRRLRHQALRLCGITVGLLACTATSYKEQADWSTSAYLVNRTRGPLPVRLRWARASLDCERLRGQLGAALSADLFGDGLTFQLEAGHSVPLRAGGAQAAASDLEAVTDNGGISDDSGVCEAVLVQAPGLADRVVLTAPDPPGEVPPTLEDPTQVAVAGLGLLGEPGRLVVAAYQGLIQARLEHDPPAPSCEVPAGSAFGWSELGTDPLEGTLEAVETRPGGCLALRLDSGRTVDLCLGAGDFPFVAGQALRLTETGLDLTRGWRRLVVEALDPTGAARLEVHAGAILEPGGTAQEGALAGQRLAVVHDRCPPVRVPCDAFVQGGRLRVDDRTDLAPGERLELPDGRVLVVGRADRVLVAPSGCELARQTPTARADLLILTPAPEGKP